MEDFYFKPPENAWIVTDLLKRGKGYLYGSTNAPTGAPTLCTLAIGIAIGRLQQDLKVNAQGVSLLILPELDRQTTDLLVTTQAKRLKVEPEEGALIHERVITVTQVDHKVDLIEPFNNGYRMTDRYYELVNAAREVNASFIGIDSAATLLPDGTPDDRLNDTIGTVAQSIAEGHNAAVVAYRT